MNISGFVFENNYQVNQTYFISSTALPDSVDSLDFTSILKTQSRQLTTTRGEDLTARLTGEKKAPYSYLADQDGIIDYKGTIFQCDYEHNVLSLGDISDEDKVITVSLSGGGTLKVNRDNLGDLSKAISMFSPEDINLIMRAITLDNKIQQMKKEIDDMNNSIGTPGTSGTSETSETTVITNVGYRAYSLYENFSFQDRERIWE